MAVVLSGTGSDGTRGLQAIKDAGGLVVVQDPDLAKFDGMPKSAIATSVVDAVLPCEQIGPMLHQYARDPSALARYQPTTITLDGEGTYDTVVRLLSEHSGVDFSEYRSNALMRRIERRMQVHEFASAKQYAEFLLHNHGELVDLYQDVLISVTRFFRDPAIFDALADGAVTELLENAQPNGKLRVWCIACATGEEAYSLAIVFRERQVALGREDVDVKIFATDLDKAALEKASAGEYSVAVAEEVAAERLEANFTRHGNSYRINDDIRRMVIFAHHDVTKDPPFYRLDLVACRNMLIYMNAELQRRVLAVIHFALLDGRVLVLGSSESIGELADVYSVEDSKLKIYRTRPGSERAVLSSLGINISSNIAPNTMFHRDGPREDRSRAASEIELYKSAMRDFMPPALVVDEGRRVVISFGALEPFVSFPIGMMTHELGNVVHPEFSTMLSTLLHKALQERKRFSYRDVRFDDGSSGESMLVDLVVEPFRSRLKEGLYIILFERCRLAGQDGDDAAEAAPRSQSDQSIPSEMRERMNDLERELQFTKESLQATIEELETANEELQATNEELLASNNDMDAVLEGTSIGVIFLDRDLRFRKFTPVIARKLSLLPSDIRRPIAHFAFRNIDGAFVEAAAVVLKSGVRQEVEAQTSDNETYVVKIDPYRFKDPVRRGVVLTFIDVTEVREAKDLVGRFSADDLASWDRTTAELAGIEWSGFDSMR